LFVTIHHDRGSRSSTSATTRTSTCVNNLKVSNYSCRNFARNKPIELIDGSNLLYLLAEHAGIEAKIVPPDDWKDPVADAPESHA
jgi:hypothetical protein